MNPKELVVSTSDIPPYLFERMSKVIYSNSTGLIKIIHTSQVREEATLIGSGTFVSIQGIDGILTADHVSKQLERNCSLGLVLTSSEHRTTIDFQLLRIISIGRGREESTGPDLSFIAIPTLKASEIKSHKSFYNISADREKMLHAPLDLHGGIWFICGVVDEKTSEENSERGFSKLVSFEGRCGAVGVDGECVNDDYDYIEAGVEYKQELDLPRSFGGFSGGGLWQVSMKKLASGTIEPAGYFLSGVIFYQSAVEEGKRFIKCHGRRSVYKVAYDKVKEACS